MCVYQSYVYIFVLTYAMQVMRELNRFLLKHLCINQTKTKNTWLWFFYIGCCFWSDIVIFLINKPKIHFWPSRCSLYRKKPLFLQMLLNCGQVSSIFGKVILLVQNFANKTLTWRINKWALTFLFYGAFHKWRHLFLKIFDPSLPLVTHFTK